MRYAKRIYYEKKLDHAKSNIKNTWKILNEVINRRKRANKLPSAFIFDNQEISNPVEIANRFCDYFTNIGPNLAKKIPAATTSYHCSLTGNFITSVFLQPATQQEILEIVNSLRLGTAAGWDMIPMCAVKDSMDLISEPLTHIINLSISSGIQYNTIQEPLFKHDTFKRSTSA